MYNLYVVDAFTSEPFRGNPAAVCLLQSKMPDAWMQNLAAEMNLSETAFLLKTGEDAYSLRWFTPATEVSLCGHATLASAHVLWSEGHVAGSEVSFETMSGTLSAKEIGSRYELRFPARVVEQADDRDDINQALGITSAFTGLHRRPNGDLFLIEIDSAARLRELAPDFTELAATGARGVIVTSPSDEPEYDFLSRFFGPLVGIDEDPVTGSAHCSLAPYWAGKLGKTKLTGYQASKRSGVVECEVDGDNVNLRGEAVTVSRGVLEI